MDTPRRLIKRVLDVELALVACLVLAPLMLAIALFIRVSMGSPVLFRQERPGLDERPFHILKFRTMSDARDASGALLPNEDRMTRLGRMLRATSLDELPELVNVLLGDMSLVGPRPLAMSYLGHYLPHERRRHSVRPGITGLAQVQGRNALAWRRKMDLDVRYVDDWSLWLDASILARTAWMIVRPAEGDVSVLGGDAFPDSFGRPPMKYGGVGK